MALTDKLRAIGNAIRAKTGGTDPIPLTDMPAAIENLASGVSNIGFDRLELDKMPDTTEYAFGEELDTTGMVVSAVYSNGAKRHISFDEFTYIDMPSYMPRSSTFAWFADKDVPGSFCELSIPVECCDSITLTRVNKGDFPKSDSFLYSDAGRFWKSNKDGRKYQITGLEAELFWGNDGISKAILSPYDIHVIGARCFRDCKYIDKITLPDCLVEIGDSAFSGCHNIFASSSGMFYLPEKLQTIGSNAFYECSNSVNFISVRVPDSVTKIGVNAFKGFRTVFYNGPATGAPWGARAMN